MAAWSFSFRNSTCLLGHFHSENHHGCVVIFIQKFNMAAVSECLIIFIQKLNMAAWSFPFRNSTWLLGYFHSEIHHGCFGHFHSEIQHGCLVIFIQKFNLAGW
jgi:hypothetical protein